MTQAVPDVSVIIPTLNSVRVLDRCLTSIVNQRTDRHLELLVVDAGSTDGSREIALRYGAMLLENPGKSGETGKAIGLRAARGDLVAFIDSDNVLASDCWFDEMAVPFTEPDVVAAEPNCYVVRRTDGYLTRYFAHLGMGDPLCLFLGNYDRFSALTGRWTDMPVRAIGRAGYEKFWLTHGKVPTIGANGFVMRRRVLMGLNIGDYLADVDVVARIAEQDTWAFAKVHCGIVHLFAEDIGTFRRKQRRRIRDYLHYRRRGMRRDNLANQHRWGIAKFVAATLIGWPVVWQALRGGYLTRDPVAWLFHPAACGLTLFEYSLGLLGSRGRTGPLARDGWSQ